MEVSKVSSVKNQNFTAKINEEKQAKTPEQIKEGKKKLALALTALGAIATAGVAIYKGKGTKLSNITFDKGIAFSQNGDKFTGKIKDKLPNGNKIVMEYVDGVLQKSTVSGRKTVEKVYETVNNEKIVKKTVNGATAEFNITKVQQEVKADQEKLKNILNNKFASANQIQYETSEIKYKSPKQKEEVLSVWRHKNEVEYEACMRQRAEERNKAKAKVKAQISQARYNLPFKDKLANKSAQESAKVFIEEHNAKIQSEALSRLEQERMIEQAQQYQNSLIRQMQNPSGNKSAKESASALLADKKPNSTISPIFDDKGHVTGRKTITKKGNVTVENLDSKGNVATRETALKNDKNWDKVTTEYGKGTKTVTSTQEGWYGADKSGVKVYSDNGGKPKLSYREVVDDNKRYRKTVEQFDDYSKTTVIDNEVETVTLRDKKGNIISEIKNNKKPPIDPLEPGAEKVYDAWYIHYAKLCKKYGVPMRPCGVEGGAGSHYFELNMLDKNPQKYYEYCRLEEYRAQYDPKAKLMSLLRECDDKGISSLSLLNQGEINIKELNPSTITHLLELVLSDKYSVEEAQQLIPQIKANAGSIRRIEDVIDFCENLGYSLREQNHNFVETMVSLYQ